MKPSLSLSSPALVGAVLGAAPGFTDFVTRLATAGYTLSAPRAAAYSAFFTQASNHGYYPNLKEIYFFEGTALAHQAVKGKYISAPNLTNNGLLVGNLLANGGYTSDTAAKYFLTGVNFSTQDPTSMGFSVFNGADISRTASPVLFGAPNAATPYCILAAAGQADIVTFRPAISALIGGTGGGGPAATVNWVGGPDFYQSARGSTTSNKLRVNGQVVASSAVAVTNATRSIEFRTGSGHASGNTTVLFSALDDGQMTDGQAVLFSADVVQLMQSLGRITKASARRNLYLFTGQSLSTGTNSGAPVSTTQPYINKMLLGGSTTPIIQGGFCQLTEFSLEAPSSGFANGVSAMHRSVFSGSVVQDSAVTGWGVGGTPYSGLAKGTAPYNNSLAAIASAITAASLENTGLWVPAVPCVHGESDIASLTYQTDIRQWQSDYNTDIKVVTGQAESIPMVHTQPSSFGTGSTARSVYAILAETRLNPRKTVHAGPKYWATYSDGQHLVAASYRAMGEYYGKAVYWEVVVPKMYSDSPGTWASVTYPALQAAFAACEGVYYNSSGPLYFTSLRPSSIVRSGAIITITLVGRVGNLVLDTTTIADPGNYGFRWNQTGGLAQTISSIALINSNTQIQITLSGDPLIPTTQRLTYADPLTGTSTGNAGGTTTGPRGCVRDSNPQVGTGSGVNLWAWMDHFDDPVV